MAVAARRRRGVAAPRAAGDDLPPPTQAYRVQQDERKPPEWPPPFDGHRPTDGELWAMHYDINAQTRECWRAFDARFKPPADAAQPAPPPDLAWFWLLLGGGLLGVFLLYLARGVA